MSTIPSHEQPTTRQECIDTWRERGRIPTPSPGGGILDMLIIHLIEATAIDGIAVDLVVEARASKRAPPRRFAVVFSKEKPMAQYPVPTLWVRSGQGLWL
jgi:hypothetical protein